jgi:hypothetical protein
LKQTEELAATRFHFLSVNGVPIDRDVQSRAEYNRSEGAFFTFKASSHTNLNDERDRLACETRFFHLFPNPKSKIQNGIRAICLCDRCTIFAEYQCSVDITANPPSLVDCLNS